MQKVTKFLERNVQWIVLGLGVLYLLWNVWGYVINDPVTVKLADGTELRPENIDEKIADTKAKALDLAMKQHTAITLPATDVLTPYLAKLDDKDSKIPSLVQAPWFAPTTELPGGIKSGEGPSGAQVAQLPTLPPAQFVAESHDITSIQVGGAEPGAVAPAGNAAVKPVIARQDVRWNSLKFKVPVAELRDQFTKAFKDVPVGRLFVTRFLKFQVLRQEKLENGQWSEAKEIKTVEPANMPPYPGDVIDPSDQNARNVGFQYKDAVSKVDLLAPTFPAIAPGAPAAYAPGKDRPVRAKAGAPRNGVVGAPKPPAPAAPAAGGGSGQNQLAAGEIDLTLPNLTDFQITVHDISAEDGKTYRYAIVYRLADPVWDTMNIASAAFAKQYALISPQSDWSKEIEVPLHTRIFVLNVNKPTSKVSFDTFEWKDTGYHRSSQEAYPGDTIRGTQWTLVDIRSDHDNSVLLLNGAGKVDVHSKRSDSQDPSYQELKDEAQTAVAAVPVGAALVKQ